MKIKLDSSSIWVDNSIIPIVEYIKKNVGDRLDLLVGFYEHEYNVKVHTIGGTIWSDVEFPSEDDAIMFILKWS